VLLLKNILHAVCVFFFRLTFLGKEHLSISGAAILTPNHVSWLDVLLIALATDKSWKFVASGNMAERNWLLGLITKRSSTIFVDPALPFALREVARHLQHGGKIVIFPEGGLSETGRLRKFYDGVAFLIMRSGAPVIRCYIRGAQNTFFARQHGPKKLFTKVSVHFCAPLKPPPHITAPQKQKPAERRQLLTEWLRNAMTNDQFQVDYQLGSKNVLHNIWNQASLFPRKQILQDISLKTVSYRMLVVGAKLLAKVFQSTLAPREKRVAVLLPNINATPVTLMALWELGRTPAILNFSAGTSSMLACAELAKIKTLITSKTFLERAKIDPMPFQKAGLRIIYLEECRAQISATQKLFALLCQTFFPAHPKPNTTGSEDAVVLFTSGSEGTPKGVALTHANITANILQCAVSLDFLKSDKVFNALPMFHSFGLTLGTLLPLFDGFSTFLYPTPLHYRIIPNFIYDTKPTILLATNTFMHGYARRANPYDFRSLRRVFVGAEKLQQEVAKHWADTFGVRLLEGYGATECSPCISMNSPFYPEPGTAGKILPGIEYKVVPVTGVSEGGRLWVRGPNVMRAYLNSDANAQFQSLGGWYDTGDMVTVTERGFVKIQGRLKRFAKISGEMVSLTAVEEILTTQLGQRFSKVAIAVVSIPDKEKGEALVAATTNPEVTIEAVRGAILAVGATALSAPKHVIHLTEIPVLGSGKTDYTSLLAKVTEQLGIH
jgi:acyl-[acyl-carrier-protein]-phospholipid O-acyltransferase/long-chain-fatty-acid--[acyl-carrier-protein] ligase